MSLCESTSGYMSILEATFFVLAQLNKFPKYMKIKDKSPVGDEIRNNNGSSFRYLYSRKIGKGYEKWPHWK